MRVGQSSVASCQLSQIDRSQAQGGLDDDEEPPSGVLDKSAGGSFQSHRPSTLQTNGLVNQPPVQRSLPAAALDRQSGKGASFARRPTLLHGQPAAACRLKRALHHTRFQQTHHPQSPITCIVQRDKMELTWCRPRGIVCQRREEPAAEERKCMAETERWTARKSPPIAGSAALQQSEQQQGAE